MYVWIGHGGGTGLADPALTRPIFSYTDLNIQSQEQLSLPEEYQLQWHREMILNGEAPGHQGC